MKQVISPGSKNIKRHGTNSVARDFCAPAI